MNREDTIRMAREAGAGHAFRYSGTNERRSVYRFHNTELERFAVLVEAKAAAAERNKLAAWMIQFGFATGHGDTMEQLLDALGTEIVDRIEFEIDVAALAEREACARITETSPDRYHAVSTIRTRKQA